MSDGKGVVLHWAGSRWARVTARLPALSFLTGVTATSPRSAWIVGTTGGIPRTLIMHWNGKTWKRVSSPDPKTSHTSGDMLQSVSAVSSKDAWASGALTSRSGTPLGGLLLHWNGKTWKHASATSVTGKSTELQGVAAASASSVFTVGCDCSASKEDALIGRWNGRAWARASSPVKAVGSDPISVTATSARNAWATGTYCQAHCSGQEPTGMSMLLHWNGQDWKAAASPLVLGDIMRSVTAISASDAWAVGVTITDTILILHWNGSSWSASS